MCRCKVLLILTVFLSACGERGPLDESVVEFGPPPPTTVEVVVDTLHGEVISDPYRWLEDGESPETRAWIDAQNAYTDAIFAQLPHREELRHLATALMRVDIMDDPVKKGGRYFYGKKRAEDDLKVVYYRDGSEGEEHVLIDPHGLSEDHSISVSSPQTLNCPVCRPPQGPSRQNDISADGTLIVYAIEKAGTPDAELRIREVETSKDLPDAFPPARYVSVQVTPENTGLYYSTRDTEAPRVWYHALGTEVSEDQEVFGSGLGVADIPYVELSPDGRWLLASVWHGTAGTLEVHLKDLSSDSEWIAISSEGMTVGAFAGDKLLLTTTVGVGSSRAQTPNYRVVTADLANPQVEHWTELLPAQEDLEIKGAAGIGGYYFVAHNMGGQPGVTQFDTVGDLVREIDFGVVGSVFGPSGDWDKKEGFVAFTSFHVPMTVYRFHVETGETEVWHAPDVPIEPESMEVRQVQVSSRDGRTFPMFVVHEKGLRQDGERPTFLTGYPRLFSLGYPPAFWPEVVFFKEMGGVFALAGPRLDEGFGAASEDFIAAAKYLIGEGYTRPDRLAVRGTSAGGLMVAGALVQRPDLFGAVVCGYPITDMIRYHKFPGAMVMISMFGNSDDPEQFEYMRRHSPYHNAVEGTGYPATLFITSADDGLVHHARKMTAVVQATNGGEKPTMLRHHLRAGHGSVSLPPNEAIEELVDRWAFYRWQVRGY